MKNKIKGIGVSVLAGVLGSSIAVSPVFAQEGGSLVEADNKNIDNYGFIYNKTHTKENRGSSLYALKLEEGLTRTGASFTPNNDQIKTASKILKSSKGKEENRVQVEYNGLYSLISLQREPGHYPYLEENMHTSDGYFEFPNNGLHNITQKVEMKEEEFLNAFDVILRGPEFNKLTGKFDLIQIGEPEEIYGSYTEEELDFISDKEIENSGYNMPMTENDKNKVKSWSRVNEKKATINITDKTSIDWSMGYSRPGVESNVENAVRVDGIEEGIYKLSQTESEIGYTLRSNVYFIVTLDNNGEPVLEFLSDDDFSSKIDVFDQKHDYEYFYNALVKNNTLSLYQTLLVNYNIPGTSPVNPEKPGDPSIDNSFSKYSKKTQSPNLNNEDADDYYVLEEEVVSDTGDDGEYWDWDSFTINPLARQVSGIYIEGDENYSGRNIKINAGEIFSLNFNFEVPRNISEYEYLHFVDVLADEIEFDENFSEDSISARLKGQSEGLIESVEFSDENGKKYIKVAINVHKADEYNKINNNSDGIELSIRDVYLKEGTVDDVYNRAYLYYKYGENETPVPENPWEKPEDKDVIDPDNPGVSLDPDDPTKPTIPTTPEIVIDPITVDFRMGVVDGGTNVLDNARYEIVSFTPTRGDGGINKDGNIYVGNAVYDIHKEVDATDGFAKFKGLPAGRYTMVETVAPVKGDKDYRLVTQSLEFRVREDEDEVVIIQPIVKNGDELGSAIEGKNTIYTSTLYNEENWNSKEVLDREAMLHHYRNINTPETGTLAQIPFFIGGGFVISTGIMVGVGRKKRR